MVIFERRAGRSAGGATAAALVALLTTLGGCAGAPTEAGAIVERIEAAAAACPSGRTRSCAVHGPRREDATCGCDDPRPLEAALGRLAGY